MPNNSASSELQRALFQKLQSSLAVHVTAHVTENDKPPIVIVGDASSTSQGTKCDRFVRHEIEIEIYVASRSREAVRNLAGEVEAALKGFTPTSQDWDFTPLFFERASDSRLDDGVSYQALMTFATYSDAKA